MDLLKAHGLIFGTSICYTRNNVDVVSSDEFLDLIIEKGCRFTWYFHYMPVGNDAATELAPHSGTEGIYVPQVREIRAKEGGKPIFAMDFQNDGGYVGGCIAGGRFYCHINPNGDMEPVCLSIIRMPIYTITPCLNVFSSPFQAYRRGQPFNENHLRPCPMLENPECLKAMVEETGARSTDLQSPESAEHLCEKCMPYAKDWKDKADELWENRKSRG